MKLGIVGLPNVGKSTLFNSITKAGAESANYPFCTIEPNVGIVAVPDERLQKLAQMYNTKKITPAVVEFVDIAGLVKGASKGEGLGNKFLSHIRETDAICEVVRCFEDSNVVHVDGSVDPIRDIETINLELIFADIETVDKRLDKAKKMLKADKKYQAEIDLLEKIKLALENGMPARQLEYNEDEKEMLKEMFLLTTKPIIYIANVSEEQLSDTENDANVNKVREYASKEKAEVIPLCVKIEDELSTLDDSDKKETKFIKDVEITCEVFEEIATIIKALEDKGFKYIEEFTLNDIYKLYNYYQRFETTIKNLQNIDWEKIDKETAKSLIKSISFIFDITKKSNPISYAVFYSMQYIFWQVVVCGGMLCKMKLSAKLLSNSLSLFGEEPKIAYLLSICTNP